jgi:NADH-quinone oxidoreductase subunit C
VRAPGPALAAVLARLPAASPGDPPRIEVPADDWVPALTALAAAGAAYLDFLTAVDRPDPAADPGAELVEVVAHVAEPGTWWHALVATRCAGGHPSLGSVASAFAGADWHERETAEMFGIAFTGHPAPGPLLLAADLGLRPLRKDAVLAARVTRPFPGAAGARGRRRPPGVPDTWPEAGNDPEVRR